MACVALHLLLNNVQMRAHTSNDMQVNVSENRLELCVGLISTALRSGVPSVLVKSGASRSAFVMSGEVKPGFIADVGDIDVGIGDVVHAPSMCLWPRLQQDEDASWCTCLSHSVCTLATRRSCARALQRTIRTQTRGRKHRCPTVSFVSRVK